MGDTTISSYGQTNYNAWTGDGEAVCTKGAPAAAPTGPEVIDVVDDCVAEDAPIICQDESDPLADADDAYDGDRFNNGKGPLLDPRARQAREDACVDAAIDDNNACMDRADRIAEKVCLTSKKGVGRFPDQTAVQPGEDHACKEAWVYGSSEKSITKGSNAGSTNGGAASSTQGGEVGAQGGVLGATISGKATWQRQEQENWSQTQGSNHAETTKKAGESGLAADCRARFEAERNKCILP